MVVAGNPGRCSRASFYVYSFAASDINLWLVDGAVTLNLWHGLGVKRIERDRGAPWDRMYAVERPEHHRASFR